MFTKRDSTLKDKEIKENLFDKFVVSIQYVPPGVSQQKNANINQVGVVSNILRELFSFSFNICLLAVNMTLA